MTGSATYLSVDFLGLILAGLISVVELVSFLTRILLESRGGGEGDLSSSAFSLKKNTFRYQKKKKLKAESGRKSEGDIHLIL